MYVELDFCLEALFYNSNVLCKYMINLLHFSIKNSTDICVLKQTLTLGSWKSLNEKIHYLDEIMFSQSAKTLSVFSSKSFLSQFFNHLLNHETTSIAVFYQTVLVLKYPLN